MAKTAKAKEIDIEGKSKFELTLEALNTTYGKGTIISLGEKQSHDYDVISTGSLAFDHALGVGGFVFGKLYELMGWEGTGKSTICGHLGANCQKKYPQKKVVYIDGEHAVDINYFQALGVDTDKMLIAQPGYGEEGFDIALKMIRSGEVGLVIIDSDSSLLPKVVMEGEVGDAAIGKKARLNNDSYPKLKAAVADYHVCLVVISQYREKIGVMFGNPTTTQGGHALKFYTDVRIELSKKLAKEGEQAYGNRTIIKALKNKLAPPHQKAEFDIVFGKGIDYNKEVFDFSVELGIIEKAGSWYSYKTDQLGQGEKAVLMLLGDNPGLLKELETLVLQKLKEL